MASSFKSTSSKRERDRRADAKRREDKPWRKWYQTERWQRLRLSVFARDLYTCQMCGVLVSKSYECIADHKVKHEGNPGLFWDEENIQLLCKPCHDGAKQQEERVGFSTAVGLDGWPTDPRHPANRNTTHGRD